MINREQLYHTLLKLLDSTTPYEYEKLIHKYLPKQGTFDSCGNYWVHIGNYENTLFSCHMDTVGRNCTKTTVLYDDGKLYAMNEHAACLGGDDRCGMLCMIAMIDANIDGTYIFHVGEESGCVGSKHIAKTYDLSSYKRAIAFDRRGMNSVITVMMGSTKVCSDEFANALCKQLDFVPDPTGLYTDTWSYESYIPEVTNLSCGYENEHSNREIIHVDWLLDCFIPKLISIDWDALPTKRDPKAANQIEKEYNWDDSIFDCCDFCCINCDDVRSYPFENRNWLLCNDCAMHIGVLEQAMKSCNQCGNMFCGKGNLCVDCFAMEIIDNNFLLNVDPSLLDKEFECLHCGICYCGKVELCNNCLESNKCNAIF